MNESRKQPGDGADWGIGYGRGMRANVVCDGSVFPDLCIFLLTAVTLTDLMWT
ncbi:hypothetical protein M493_16970 [Geobacillus genomosp. 3]|uniref:Uncharacterized protein n=1 Tax=Geobacillus genomosp. 3 TaxID=1921421 RepID=S5ZSV9_GEOG3|nr:hypothetical protein M493_16970 [Geobacillus genomosp. 3]